MKCKEILKTFFVYNELTEQERQVVDDHIFSCDSCKKEFEKICDEQQKLKAILKTNWKTEQAQDVSNRIMAALNVADKNEENQKTFSILSYATLRYAASLISIIMIIAFTIEYSRTSEQLYAQRKESVPSQDFAVLTTGSIQKYLKEPGTAEESSTIMSRYEQLKKCKTTNTEKTCLALAKKNIIVIHRQ